MFIVILYLILNAPFHGALKFIPGIMLLVPWLTLRYLVFLVYHSRSTWSTSLPVYSTGTSTWYPRYPRYHQSNMITGILYQFDTGIYILWYTSIPVYIYWYIRIIYMVIFGRLVDLYIYRNS
jgi:hypothetical protein